MKIHLIVVSGRFRIIPKTWVYPFHHQFRVQGTYSPLLPVRILSGVLHDLILSCPSASWTNDARQRQHKMLQLQKRLDDQIRLKGEAKLPTRAAIQLFAPDRIVLSEPQILYDPRFP